MNTNVSPSALNSGHPLFIRIFLRHCAWFLSWKTKHTDYWVWHSANYSMAMFLATIFGFVCVSLLLIVDLHFPVVSATLFSNRATGPFLCIVLGFSIVFYIEYRTKAFKDNVAAARKYMVQSERLKFWALNLLGIGFIGATLGIVLIFGKKIG